MPHPADTDPLYARIRAFPMDERPVAYGFLDRLARDNAWSRPYAARVIDEYKKFLYLCATAGVPMTPSREVDEAWHLHLLYTRSYWERLCKQVLGRPLHHHPTQGGAAERAKFHAWYERTLAAYRAAFGAEPPADIWPPASIRFGPAPRTPRTRGHAARLALCLVLAGALASCTGRDVGVIALYFVTLVGGGALLAALFGSGGGKDHGSCGGSSDGDGCGGDGCGCGCGCG